MKFIQIILFIQILFIRILAGPLCQSGPINIRCGVVNFQENIDMAGGLDSLKPGHIWMDTTNTLSFNMRIDGQEEVIAYTTAGGKKNKEDSCRLCGQFIEVDITDQINWMLYNSGQWAIVLLSDTGIGYVPGRATGFTNEECNSTISDTGTWTRDGNTAHIKIVTCRGMNDPCQTHIFWYRLNENKYSFTDCDPGPCLDPGKQIHDSLILTGSNHSYINIKSVNFTMGQGYCSFIWSEQLNISTGIVTSAFFRAEYNDGWEEDTDVQRKLIVPGQNDVISLFPNPFNTITTLRVEGKFQNEKCKLLIYDIHGKMVLEKTIQGSRTVVWDATGLGAGIYIIKVRVGNKKYSRRIILQK